MTQGGEQAIQRSLKCCHGIALTWEKCGDRISRWKKEKEVITFDRI
jgi:hypothetical protein